MSRADPLRLLVYDRTCRGPRLQDRLSVAWEAGSILYRALGRLDASLGVSSWQEALGWLTSYESSRPIREFQYWGHGKWGAVLIGKEALGRDAFLPGHALYPLCEGLRARLLPDGRSLLWLRTCEAFGAERGHAFARSLADFFGCRVAGHTHVIGYWQSGLHSILPGAAPDWPLDEGLAAGTPGAPERALASRPDAPNTISCLAGEMPEGW
jgi:hypothetical protein